MSKQEQSRSNREGEKADQRRDSPGAGWTADPKAVRKAKRRVKAEIKRIDELSQDIDWGRLLAIIVARFERLWGDELDRIKAGETIDLAKSSKLYLDFLDQTAKAYKNLKQAVEGIRLTVEPSPQVSVQIVEAAKKYALEVIKIAYDFIGDSDDRQRFTERVKGLSISIDGPRGSQALPARGSTDEAAD